MRCKPKHTYQEASFSVLAEVFSACECPTPSISGGEEVGMGQNLTTRNWTAGRSPWFHLSIGQAILGSPHF